MPEVKCKAVLFDLDGTLVDSCSSIENFWSRWAIKNHIDVNYVLSVIHGRNIEEALKLISPYFHNEDCIEEIKVLAIEELSHVSPVAGAVDFMKKIPVKRIAIVTSGAWKVAIASIRGAGLSVPDLVITSEDVWNDKPDPEPYLKATQLLDVQPDDCLVFEDADCGIQSAIAAGMRVIAVGSFSHRLKNRQDGMQLDNYKNILVDIEGDLMTLSW
ncbi:phosphatase [Rouxiella silvae]|uniref:Phosphatase n=1 Tax=Rouxiella silvae TaxID=1646373 RepID=A0ABX3U053_9GAMM|nr:HAD-IA family hydrolase [Rouxiella silvae]ORJ20864.1 phosphatase [Rouxiella silvae]